MKSMRMVNYILAFDDSYYLIISNIYVLKILGGIATVEDFNNYKSLVKKPIVMQLKNNYKMLTQPPPSSGILVGFIMRLMNSKKKIFTKILI